MNNPLLSASEQAHINDARSNGDSALSASIIALKGWLVRYAPLVISLALIAAAMGSVSGNLTAQALFALILTQPLSAWLARHARTH